MRNNKFKTKEEYLQYRKDWKDQYKLLSQIIKDKKWLRNRSNNAWSKAWIECNGKTDGKSETWSARYEYYKNYLNYDVTYKELSDKYKNDRCIESYQIEVRLMLSELKDAKVEANRQYLAGKQNLTSVAEVV